MIRSRLFYIVLIFSIGYGILVGAPEILYSSGESGFVMDGRLVAFSVMAGLVSAVFTGLFSGTEYSDGTIRNKLIVGHGRTAIYISGFIVCLCANLIFTAAYYASVTVTGLLNGGRFETDGKILAVCVICGLMIAMASTAVMVLLAALISSRAICITACILAAIAFIVGSAYINQKLEAPEYYDQYIAVGENGVPQQVDKVPNPAYVSGTERKVLETALDILPNGQAMLLTAMFDEGEASDEVLNTLYRWIAYSAAFTAVFTAAGAAAFGRKEIK